MNAASDACASTSPLTETELLALDKMGVPDLKKLCVKYEFDIKGLTVKRQLLELLRGQPVSEHTPKVRGSALPREPAPRLGPRALRRRGLRAPPPAAVARELGLRAAGWPSGRERSCAT